VYNVLKVGLIYLLMLYLVLATIKGAKVF
jgi:hypothetical protein